MMNVIFIGSRILDLRDIPAVEIGQLLGRHGRLERIFTRRPPVCCPNPGCFMFFLCSDYLDLLSNSSARRVVAHIS